MLAVISDIHSNLEALDAVLEAIGTADDVEAIFVLGDIVGYGADPDAVVERLGGLEAATSLAGNHDLAATGRFDATWFNHAARAALTWTAETMSADTAARLSGLEPRAEAPAGLLVHGSVVDPAAEYVVEVGDATSSFAAGSFERCFFGHTHLPTVFTADPAGVVRHAAPADDERIEIARGHRAMLNPGSVGQPRDGDPRAAFLLFDPETRTASFRRVAYDVARAQGKIRAAGLPDVLADRLSVGR